MYVWEPPGKTISVRLNLDLVDRMQQDVMRGFGAVPKRGAEVGGVLLGRAAPGEKLVVTIDDYELVPIQYKRSPSYLLSEEDAQAFQAFLKMQRSGTQTVAIVSRTSQTPLLIGGACADVVELSRHIEALPRLGAILGDVRAARHLAQAALASAIDIAEQDIGLHTDLSEQQAMRDAISELRRR